MDPVTAAIILASVLGAGSMGLGQLGAWGSRGLEREKIKSSEKMFRTQTESTKRATKESERRATEYMEKLLREKRSERIFDRENMMMQSFLASQDRQMAMVMQAIQGVTQSPYAPSMRPGLGIVGSLRSNI